ncbi:hypothetical protein MLD38_000515 [Melastoma candidum]|uniref:Uncharacterized protein n=1 Tax=Melastoma candidum TaxID=119954 RepID=A0ACB9SE92_9MYRT|nr:hypothetical protein MLD38_000515 [Melastoma candidum]
MGKPPCCEKDEVKRGPWSTEEDNILIDYIKKNGPGRWRTLPKNAGLKRCGKSCRLRWANYLRPDIKRGRFSPEEEEAIVQLHSVLGNKWSTIAVQLPGRTDNEIKNFWNTHIKKKLLRMGIDPVTHAPRFDLLDLQSILALYSYSHQSLPYPAPLYGTNMGIHPSNGNFSNECRLGATSLPNLGNTSTCSFPNFSQRATDNAQANNTSRMNNNGCKKVQNYGSSRFSPSLPMSGSSIALTLPSATTTYIGSSNIGDAENTEGCRNHSSVSYYDYGNGLSVNGLM